VYRALSVNVFPKPPVAPVGGVTVEFPPTKIVGMDRGGTVIGTVIPATVT
jgi:hypothetical protein